MLLQSQYYPEWQAPGKRPAATALPRWSVLIPFFNERDFLDGTLANLEVKKGVWPESVRLQTAGQIIAEGNRSRQRYCLHLPARYDYNELMYRLDLSDSRLPR